jgi:hypothetical protein
MLAILPGVTGLGGVAELPNREPRATSPGRSIVEHSLLDQDLNKKCREARLICSWQFEVHVFCTLTELCQRNPTVPSTPKAERSSSGIKTTK